MKYFFLLIIFFVISCGKQDSLPSSPTEVNISSIKVLDSYQRELGKLVKSDELSMTIMSKKGYIFSIGYDGHPYNFGYSIYSNQSDCGIMRYEEYIHKFAIDADKVFAGTLLLIERETSGQFMSCSVGPSTDKAGYVKRGGSFDYSTVLSLTGGKYYTYTDYGPYFQSCDEQSGSINNAITFSCDIPEFKGGGMGEDDFEVKYGFVPHLISPPFSFEYD